MMYPLVRELAADGIPVTVTCRVLQLARQPYYRWLVKPHRRPRPRAGVPGQRRDRRPPRRSGPGYRLLADEVRCRPGRVRRDGVADLRGQPVALTIAIRGPMHDAADFGGTAATRGSPKSRASVLSSAAQTRSNADTRRRSLPGHRPRRRIADALAAFVQRHRIIVP